MADSARIQQIECCNGTGSDADTEEGRNHRWYVKEYHLLVYGSDGWILSDPYAVTGHPVHSSEHSQRDALGTASNATAA